VKNVSRDDLESVQLRAHFAEHCVSRIFLGERVFPVAEFSDGDHYGVTVRFDTISM